ncbi:MAG: hypothetical protein AAFR58_23235, partial [Cyanobacteria bacterium J06627_28]
MRNYRHLPTFTLSLLFLSGVFKPFNFFIVEALAACSIRGGVQNQPTTGALEPASNEAVVCDGADTAGINAANSTGVTVTIQSPGASVTAILPSG